MKINEFEKEVFYDFVSKTIGVDVKLYIHDLKFKNTPNLVKLSFFVGGESADGRVFTFTDDSCEFMNACYNVTQDLSRNWINYLADEICEEDEDANYFIDKYNSKLDAKINAYAQKQNSLKI